MIILNIAQQPIGQIFNILQAEVHPPLFYILAKLLPTMNLDLSRLMITICSYGLVFLTIRFLAKKRFPGKASVDLGLAIFLCSYTFLDISSDIKRQVLAVPVFLLSIALTVIVSKTRKSLILLNLALLSIFLLDYISYFWAILMFSFIALSGGKSKLFFRTAVLQFMALLGYFLFFGRSQNHYDISATGVLVDFLGNNPVLTFLQHIAGRFAFFAMFIGFLLLFFAAIGFLGAPNLFALTIFASAFAYFAHLYARPRYSYFPFLLLGLAASRGMIKVIPKVQIYLILLVIFVIGFAGFADHKLWLNTFHGNLKTMVNKSTDGGRVGLLTNGRNVFPHVFWQNYLKNDSVIPINAANMAIFTNKNWLTREDMASAKEDNLENRLTTTVATENISTIAYIWNDYGGVNDEFEQVILRVCGEWRQEEIVPGTKLKLYRC